jgi:hypothetical protein
MRQCAEHKYELSLCNKLYLKKICRLVFELCREPDTQRFQKRINCLLCRVSNRNINRRSNVLFSNSHLQKKNNFTTKEKRIFWIIEINFCYYIQICRKLWMARKDKKKYKTINKLCLKCFISIKTKYLKLTITI